MVGGVWCIIQFIPNMDNVYNPITCGDDRRLQPGSLLHTQNFENNSTVLNFHENHAAQFSRVYKSVKNLKCDV